MKLENVTVEVEELPWSMGKFNVYFFDLWCGSESIMEALPKILITCWRKNLLNCFYPCSNSLKLFFFCSLHCFLRWMKWKQFVLNTNAVFILCNNLLWEKLRCFKWWIKRKRCFIIDKQSLYSSKIWAHKRCVLRLFLSKTSVVRSSKCRRIALHLQQNCCSKPLHSW